LANTAPQAALIFNTKFHYFRTGYLPHALAGGRYGQTHVTPHDFPWRSAAFTADGDGTVLVKIDL